MTIIYIDEVCECGCLHSIHTELDSVDDGGVSEGCANAEACGCTGFWN